MTIDLPHEHLHVILLDGDGQAYCAQVGGYACHHPVAIGILDDSIETLSIEVKEKLSDELMEYFDGPDHNGWCCDGIDEKTATALDKILLPVGVVVDRTRFDLTEEAWIYGFKDGRPCIVVTDNSD